KITATPTPNPPPQGGGEQAQLGLTTSRPTGEDEANSARRETSSRLRCSDKRSPHAQARVRHCHRQTARGQSAAQHRASSCVNALASVRRGRNMRAAAHGSGFAPLRAQENPEWATVRRDLKLA